MTKGKSKSRSKGTPLNVDINYKGSMNDREQTRSNFIRDRINQQISNHNKVNASKKSEIPKSIKSVDKVVVPDINPNEISSAMSYIDYTLELELYELQTKIEELEREYNDEYEEAFDCDRGWYVDCEHCGNNRLTDTFTDHCTCVQKVVWSRKVVYC